LLEIIKLHNSLQKRSIFIIFAPMFLKRPHIALLLVSILFFSSCSSKFMKLQKKGTTEEKYKAANDYYKNGDYYKAGILFEEIIPLLKGDSLAENAQFYNAYAQFQQKQFSMSAYLFKSFYATYANSPMAEEAFYMYANSMYKDSPNFDLDQSSTLTAIDALQTFINSFPESKYSDGCNQNLKDLRHRLEEKSYTRMSRPQVLCSLLTLSIFRKPYTRAWTRRSNRGLRLWEA